MSLLDKLSSEDGTSVKKGLSLLVAYYALALLTGKTAQATGVLREIEVLYEDSHSEASHQWIEVLTDIILVMISDECGLCRKVASQVFRMTMLHQTQKSLALLIKVCVGVLMWVSVWVSVWVCGCCTSTLVLFICIDFRP